MTSIHFNAGSRSAQGFLRSAERSLAASESRLASGLRVQSARDNAAYWSIARAMHSDLSASAALRDGLHHGMAVLDTALAAAAPVLRGIDRIKEIFTIGRQATPEEALVYDREIRSIADQLETVIKSASFAGENLLFRTNSGPRSKAFVAGLGRAGDGSLSLQRITLNLDHTVLIDEEKTLGLLSTTYWDRYNYTSGRRLFSSYGGTAWLLRFYNSQNGSLFNDGGRKANIDLIEQIGTAVRTGFATLGSVQRRLEIQRDFVERLGATQTRGLGRLVDANLTEESARIRAEETRRMLALQALHMANGQSGRMIRTLLS